MRKFLGIFLTFVMLSIMCTGNVGTVIAQDNITVTVNGNILSFDQPPIIKYGRTLVPLRAIFEALGAEVEWNGETRTIFASKFDREIFMEIDKTTMFVGDNFAVTRLTEGTLTDTSEIKIIELDVAPMIVNDRTLVPVRAVAERFNCIVSWDDNTKTVTITE